MHESSDVTADGGSVTLVGVRVQVRPDGVEADTLSETLLANPFCPVIVTVEFPVDPVLTAVGTTGPAEMEKSTTLTLIRTVYLSDPLIATIVIV